MTIVLLAFDSSYDNIIRNKSSMKKMKIIYGFLNSKEHCCITPYTLDLILCGEDGCTMCASFVRVIRTPYIVVRNFNLCEEVLMWMYLPVFNQNDPKILLPPQEYRGKTKITESLFKNPINIISDNQNNAEEQDALLRDK